MRKLLLLALLLLQWACPNGNTILGASSKVMEPLNATSLRITDDDDPEPGEERVQYQVSIKEINNKYLFFDKQNITLVVTLTKTKEGEEHPDTLDLDDWDIEWSDGVVREKDENGNFSIFAEFDGEDGKNYVEKELSVTLKNQDISDDAILSDPFKYKIYKYDEPTIDFGKSEWDDFIDKKITINGIRVNGGNLDGWEYRWFDKNGNQLNKDVKKNSIVVGYDGNLNTEITLKVENKAQNEETLYTGNNTYKIIFKQYYKLTLQAENGEGKEPLNVLENLPVKFNINLYNETKGEDVEKPLNDENGWEIYDCEPSDQVDTEEMTFTPYYEGDGIDPVEVTLKLTLKNEELSQTVPGELKFNVYPEPKIVGITGGDQNPYDRESRVQLEVQTEGGSGKWIYSWKDNDKSAVSQEKTYEVDYNDQDEHKIVVTATSRDPEEGTWINGTTEGVVKKVSKIIRFKEPDEDDKYSIALDFDPDYKNVLDGDSVQITVKVNKDGQEITNLEENGLKLEWTPEGIVGSNEEGKYIYLAHNDSINPFKEEKFTLTLKKNAGSNNNESSDEGEEDGNDDHDGDDNVISEELQDSEDVTFFVYLKPEVTPTVNDSVFAISNDTIIVSVVDIETNPKLGVKTFGGNPHGWQYIWKDNEHVDTTSYYIVTYEEGQFERVITLTTRNLGPDSVIWLNDTTFTFVVRYVKPAEYSVNLYADKHTCVLEGDSIPVHFNFRKGNEPVDLVKEEWTISWNQPDSLIVQTDSAYTFIIPALEEGRNVRQDSLILTLSNDSLQQNYSKVLIFNVYRVPEVNAEKTSITDVDKNDPVILKANKNYDDPDYWTFEWLEDGNTLPGADTCKISFADDKYTRNITLVAKFICPDGFILKEDSIPFTVEFQVPIVYALKLGTKDTNLMDGCETDVTFTLSMKKVNSKDWTTVTDLEGWTITWDPEVEKKDGKYFFQGVYEGDNDRWEQVLTLTIEKEDADTLQEAITFTIWPQPVVKDEDWIESAEFKDINNPTNKLQKGIRAGNKLGLPEETPDISINHEWEGYEWKYVWSVDGKEYDDVVDIPTKSDDQYSLEITCLAQYTNGKDVMWEKVVGTRTLNVFKMPPTPTYFVQKGNGTSNTWIISGFKKESSKDRLAVGTYKTNGGLTEVKAISESINATITENGTGWFIMEGHRDAKDLCLYTVRDYGDNVVITSDILPVNLTSVVKWDGSTYENRGILPQSAPSVTGVYSVDGVKTSSMVRGLNIIRLEDGTVRKVFKK